MTSADVQNALSVAAIHATLMAIIFGALVGYMVYAYGKSDDMIAAAVHEADRVNTLSSPGLFSGRGPEDLRLVATAEGRRQLASNFVREMMAAGAALRIAEERIAAGRIPDLQQVAEQAEHAGEALRILSVLVNSYPFLQSVEPQQGGGFGYSPTPKRIDFGSVDAVRQWVKDVETLSGLLLWAVQMQDREALIRALDAQQDAQRRAQLESTLARTPGQTAADIRARLERAFGPRLEMSVRPLFHGFVRIIAGANEIAAAAGAQLIRFDRYKARQPPGWKLLTLLGATCVFFFAFVMYPIACTYFPGWPGIPRLALAFVPGLFYLVMVVLSLRWIHSFV